MTSRSPTALLAPYTDSGESGRSSRIGPGWRPSKTYSDERCTAFAAQLRQGADTVDVHRPDRVEVGRVLGGIHGRPRRRVEHDGDAGPVVRAEGLGIGDVELGAGKCNGIREPAAQCPTQLAVGTEHDSRHCPRAR